MGKKNDNTLVKNASFLMIAALISKIIGMLYKSPLSNTLGNNSMGPVSYTHLAIFFIVFTFGSLFPLSYSEYVDFATPIFSATSFWDNPDLKRASFKLSLKLSPIIGTS